MADAAIKYHHIRPRYYKRLSAAVAAARLWPPHASRLRFTLLLCAPPFVVIVANFSPRRSHAYQAMLSSSFYI